MSLFSKLFSKRDNPEQFAAIAHKITLGLEHGRESWFNLCVEAMEASSDCHIVNRKLGGTADLAIKAFQLLNTVTIIANKVYISRPNGSFFSDILFAQVCGTDLEQVNIYFQRYWSIASDETAQLSRFSGDVATYISGNEQDLYGMLHIAPLYQEFIYITMMVVADGFGDSTLAKHCQEKLR